VPRPQSRPHFWPVLTLVFLPVAASGLILLGVVDNNPAGVWTFLGAPTSGTWLSGVPGYFDVSIGLLTQPLGRLSALDWLHGIIPWWNPYSGVGMPLAAEMQTWSFFLPFVLLLKWWQGWLWIKILMQLIAGLSTYALLLQLGCRRAAALPPAVLFAMNGAFLMMPQALGSMAFLPLTLLGVERAAAAAEQGKTAGWLLIPLGLAYSLYGGYPEIAYLDGWLAVAWTLERFFSLGPKRWRFAAKIGVGTAIGVALSLPLVVPFLEYAAQSFLGYHEHYYSTATMRRVLAPVTLFPFAYGPIPTGHPPGLPAYFAFDWNDLGGWFGLTAAVPALAAITRARSDRHRGRIIVLALFVLIGLARDFGLPGIRPVLNTVIPDFAQIDAVRFLWPGMEMAIFVLAGIGLDRWMTAAQTERRASPILVILVLAMALVVLMPDLGAIASWYRASEPTTRTVIAIANPLELLAGLIILAALLRAPTRRMTRLVPALIVLDAFLTASLPQFCAPRGYDIHTGGIAYLREHLGSDRFYTLRPFGPDYPAGYRLASINDNQLPVSRDWSDYITARLDPHTNGIMFVGWWAPKGIAAGEAALRDNLKNYEAIGVRYILADPGTNPFRRSILLAADDAPAGFTALAVGQSAEFVVPPGSVPLPSVDRVGVLIGTYDGQSRGSLAVQLCADAVCASGSASLDHARDNALLPIDVAPALTLPKDTPLTLRLTHHGPSGAVAIWLHRGRNGAKVPQLQFSLGPRQRGITRVYQDRAMTIYRLPNARPFFSASPACDLVPHGWNQVTADCPAPARLERLEAWFRGWHATIDGHAVPIERSGEIFQSINLPAGHSRVDFFYRPRFTRISVAIALIALVTWLGLVLRYWVPRRRQA